MQRHTRASTFDFKQPHSLHPSLRFVSSDSHSFDTTGSSHDHTEGDDDFYFDPSISEEEWLETTHRLLSTATISNEENIDQVSFTPRDVVLAEQTIRYWTTQRTIQGLRYCFRLLDTLFYRLQEHPELLEAGESSYMFTGNYPRATHLINAVMDTWRILYEHKDIDQQQSQLIADDSILPKDPYQAHTKVQHWTNTLNVPLSCRTYSIIMQAAISRPDVDTPIFCETLLNQMLQQPHTMPDTVAFTTAIHSWSTSKRPEAPLRAEQLFHELVQLHDSKVLDAAPNTVTYNTVIHVMCQSKQPDCIQRAHKLFADMQLSPYANVQPNTVSFRILIQAWTSIGRIDQACALLQEMVQYYQAKSDTVQVDATLFSHVISILAKSKQPAHHQRAQELYQVLQRLFQETQDDRFHPDNVLILRAMIIVYSKLQQPESAEALLQRLEYKEKQQRKAESTKKNEKSTNKSITAPSFLPKRGHYRDVLFTWAKSPAMDAAERAERILLRMTDSLAAEPALVDKFTVDTVLQLWSKQSSQGQVHAAERGERLLRSLQALNRDANIDVCKIGRSAYLHVMKGWASSKDGKAVERIEGLFSELRKQNDAVNMMPTRMHYTVLATAWVKSRRPKAIGRIQELIDDAGHVYKAGCKDARPDKGLYGVLIHAFAQQGDAERAEGVIDRMVQESIADCQPTISELNLVLLACLRSKNVDKETSNGQLQRLKSLMHRMKMAPNKRTQDLLVELETNLS